MEQQHIDPGSATSQRTLLPVLGEIDGRTAPARAFKRVAGDIAEDLGGADHLTRAQIELVKRAAGLAVLAEQQEASLLAGEPIDAALYMASINALRRTLGVLGMDRRARDVTSLAELLEAVG